MHENHHAKRAEEKAGRREKKRNPKVKMSGKRTREIPRLWHKRTSA